MAFVGLDEEVKSRFSDSQYVRFTEAVFTHPVLQGKELKVFQHLLYKAAQFAGLNQFKRNGEPMDFDYFVNRCLQNETQAAITTLISQLQEGTLLSSVFKEELGVQQFDENTFIPILNVDMGGVTTDLPIRP